MNKKFLRKNTKKYKRFKRKKNQKWRKPKGGDNKVRKRIKGHMKKVQVGFRREKSERGKINGRIPVYVKNFRDLRKVKKNSLVIIGKIGKKKRQELEKKVKENGGEILNIWRKNES